MGNIINSIIFTPVKPNKTVILNSNESINFLQTKRNYKIPYAIFENNHTNVVIIYSYGNCECINAVSMFCRQLSLKTGATVLTYDYPGYGIRFKDEPKASERLVKEDVIDITDFVVNKYPSKKIIHYGRSIGSGPACYASYMRPGIVSGLVLESAFTSIFKTILHVSFNIWGDVFKNIDIIKNIDVPTLLIHGEKDKIVPFYHALELKRYSRNLWGTLFIKNGTHNNLNSSSNDGEIMFKLTHFVQFIDRK